MRHFAAKILVLVLSLVALTLLTNAEDFDHIAHATRVLEGHIQPGYARLHDAAQPQFVHVYKWQPGDLIMWDNHQTMHRVRRYNKTQPRDMRRTTVSGSEMTAEQAA